MSALIVYNFGLIVLNPWFCSHDSCFISIFFHEKLYIYVIYHSCGMMLCYKRFSLQEIWCLSALAEPRGSFYNPVGGCVIPFVLNLQLTRVQFEKIIKYYLNVNLYVGSNSLQLWAHGFGPMILGLWFSLFFPWKTIYI